MKSHPHTTVFMAIIQDDRFIVTASVPYKMCQKFDAMMHTFEMCVLCTVHNATLWYFVTPGSVRPSATSRL